MSSDPTKQYRMQLNLIRQAGYAEFEIKVESCAPNPKEPLWQAMVTILGVTVNLSQLVSRGTFTQGIGPTKTAAREAACLQMLHIFASVGIRPGQVP